jgi:hypothetical protein
VKALIRIPWLGGRVRYWILRWKIPRGRSEGYDLLASEWRNPIRRADMRAWMMAHLVVLSGWVSYGRGDAHLRVVLTVRHWRG